MSRRVSSFVALVGAAAVAALPSAVAGAEAADSVRARYTKYEYRIPMRDGVKLFTAVYVPKDAGASRRYPILLNRTPYSVAPYGSDAFPDNVGPSEAAAKEGFIFVYQDVRGRFMSEGQFVDVRPFNPAKGPKDVDESSDTWDTIDWLLKKLPWDNGKVGVWGISYPGFYAAMAAIDAHPALVAASPQAPIADWFVGDDFHHNGAFFLPHAFNFYTSFGKPRPEPTTKWPPRFDHGTADGYEFFLRAGPLPNLDRKYLKGEVAFWKEVMAHESYDAFWQARNTRPHLKGIRPAVLTVGGWFDAEDLFGALETYRSIESQSPGIANRLVMGPWPHGGWSRGTGDALGKVTFGQPTSKFFEEQIELPFFRFLLKGGDDPKLPEAYVFETGSERLARPRPVAATGGPAPGLLPLRERPALPGAVRRDDRGLRRVRLRPGQARSLRRERRYRHGARVHGGGPALRRAAAGRPRLPDRAARGGPDDRGADHRQPEGLDDRHRRRLGGQADRRLPGRLPAAAGRDDRRAFPADPLEDGRLPAARARRALPRQVPEELREAGALRARARWRGWSSRCPTPSTPSGGATGSWCRCRAAGSRW